ncbi:MAG: hypothetical protein GY862_11815 [Gammaproteobacteria bacterium]|nr:hypothetical protein [Gammaproteobacteria bacterium]
MNASLTIRISEDEPYECQVVFAHPDDETRCTPISFSPLLVDVDADKYKQPQEKEDEPKIFSEPVDIVRHGMVIVRVYGPDEGSDEELRCLASMYRQCQKTTEIEMNSRTYEYDGDKGEYACPSVSQAVKTGRKTETVREELIFRGDMARRIKYWYDDPESGAVMDSEWHDKDGERITDKNDWPRNAGGWTADNRATTPIHNENGDIIDYNVMFKHPGDTYSCKKSMWGMLPAEYDAGYTEYKVLYDFEDPEREIEVHCGKNEKCGTEIFNPQGALLERLDISDNPVNTEDEMMRQFRKATLKGAKKSTPIQFFITNGKSNRFIKWNPPTPEYNDLSQKELPRFKIWQKITRLRVYANGASSGSQFAEMDRTDRVKFINNLGHSLRVAGGFIFFRVRGFWRFAGNTVPIGGILRMAGLFLSRNTPGCRHGIPQHRVIRHSP